MITRIKKMNSDYQTLITSRYPNEFKKKVILYAEQYNNSEAERIFGIAESNIRRWRKLKSLIFSKGFVAETTKKKRLIKKVARHNEDFIYEIEKVDDTLRRPKQSISKDYTRITKPEHSPKMKQMTSPPVLSPSIPPVQDTKSSKAADTDEVCLRWNSHHSNMKISFPSLLQREQYVDVTLTSEGKSLKCHRLILSSCSAYFDELLSGISPLQHPVIFLNGVSFWILKSLIDFMYAGEVHIEQNKLEGLLKVAEMLQIKGLTGKSSPTEEPKLTTPPPPLPPPSTSLIQPVKPEKQTPEPKIPILKKESIPLAVSSTKTPVKKIISPKLVSAIDPLSLLEPTFFEENPVPLKFKEHVTKKVATKKIKKRKSSEHEPSPPPILFRKGTKSRPHVKVPRYYHNDFEDFDGRKSSKKEEPPVSMNIVDVNKIKLEPLDIGETDIQSGDKGKSSDSIDKVKFKLLPDKKVETNEETKPEELEKMEEFDSTNANNMTDLLEKEIKLEKIDVDYIDVGSEQVQNLTI